MDTNEITILLATIGFIVALSSPLWLAPLLEPAIDLVYGPKEHIQVQGKICKVSCKEDKCCIVFKDGRVINVMLSWEKDELELIEDQKVLLVLSKRKGEQYWCLEKIKQLEEINCSPSS